MNWGKYIILVFLSFAIFVLYFVVKMSKTNAGSVPNNYYEKSLNYTESMRAEYEGKKFKPDVVSLSTGVIRVDFDERVDSFRLRMLWPPDENNNQVFIKKNGDTSLFHLTGPRGFWNAQLEFYFNGKKYLYRKKVWAN